MDPIFPTECVGESRMRKLINICGQVDDNPVRIQFTIKDSHVKHETWKVKGNGEECHYAIKRSNYNGTRGQMYAYMDKSAHPRY